jgi:hypothetical protein
VLDEVALTGGTPGQVAARLGLPTSLVKAVLDHAERLGVVAVPASGCGPRCPGGPDVPPACAGCPVALP